MKEEVERLLNWLEADWEMRKCSKTAASRKAWLTKTMGISGANQMKGAIKTLRFLLEGWEE
jgi:hypothetical protein